MPACHVLLRGRLQVMCTANASQVFASCQANCACRHGVLTGVSVPTQAGTGLAIFHNATAVQLQAGCALLCVCLLLENRSKRLCDQCKLERLEGFFGHGLRLYYADTVTSHRLGLLACVALVFSELPLVQHLYACA